jgi:hypothetical protein
MVARVQWLLRFASKIRAKGATIYRAFGTDSKFMIYIYKPISNSASFGRFLERKSIPFWLQLGEPISRSRLTEVMQNS